MSKRWFWFRVLATLLLVGLLAVGGYVVYRTAWSQGYVTGQMAAEGGESAPAPSPFARPGWPYGFAPYRPFGGVGLLLMIVLALLFFGMVGRLIGFVIWGTAFRHAMAGKWPKYWQHYHRRWHHFPGRPPRGPAPPWFWDWEEEPADEGPAEAES